MSKGFGQKLNDASEAGLRYSVATQSAMRP